MYYTQCLLPIVLPIIFWAVYHYHQDHRLPEPVPYLIMALLLGVASYYLGLALYTSLEIINLRSDAYWLAETDLARLFAYAVLVIGPVEELAKLIPFLLVIIHIKAFDEPIDGIIYASFIALGFAAVENIHHLRYLSGLEAWGRAWAGPLLHIAFSSIWGYYIGRAYLCRRPLLPVVLGSLAVAAVIHGSYDFVVLGLAPRALPVAAALIVAVWIWRLSRIRDLHTLPSGPCPDEGR